MVMHRTGLKKYTSSDPFLLVPYLEGSMEAGLAAAGSIVAHFTTLRAQKFILSRPYSEVLNA